MKKHLFSLLVALVATAGSLPMAAQEAYAVLTEADYTLTFYYDNLRSTRPGTEYDMPTTGATPGWAGCQKIKHAVFDASFADYRPTSTSLWFQKCMKLQDIKDIRNLNTENVIDMSLMFQDCSSLASLDLTGFNTERVTNMGGMGIALSSMCAVPMLRWGEKALADCRAHKVTDELTEVILGIIVSTGLVSNFVQVDYTTGLAHAVYNGFTVLKSTEENHHLHGEVVSYGILVLLTVDKQYEEREKVFNFNRSMGLPTKLSDIHATPDDVRTVAEKALKGIDVRKYPYEVTEDMIVDAITELEKYNAEH